MLFNSFTFMVFAAVFFTLWPFLCRHKTIRWLFITASSFIFYGWWDWRYSFLLLGIGILTFVFGIVIEKYPARKKTSLVAYLFLNLGALFAFKYLGFVTETLAWLATALRMPIRPPVFSLALPVGVSFFTFQSITYIADIYKGNEKPTKSLFHYLSFATIFPHLVAGPILRASDILPQLDAEAKLDEEKAWEGLKLIAAGFFKKVVLADTFAAFVDKAFASSAASLPFAPTWWIVMTLFAFQIYCDFSGYTDIARGLGKWMGYNFPLNFNAPYTSTSIREFWTRWHISLSTWFRDYVYIPLGGNKRGRTRWYLAMWATMLLSGLWHGAAWTFVLWGAVHALYLSVERATRWPERLKKLRTAGSAIASALVIVQVWIAWVFFRAESLPQAFSIIRTMFSPAGWNHMSLYIFRKWFDPAIINKTFFLLAVAVVMEIMMSRKIRESKFAESKFVLYIAQPLLIGAAVAACVFFRAVSHKFIYFQF